MDDSNCKKVSLSGDLRDGKGLKWLPLTLCNGLIMMKALGLSIFCARGNAPQQSWECCSKKMLGFMFYKVLVNTCALLASQALLSKGNESYHHQLII